MKIKSFQVEEWMNAYETKAKYNIAETCTYSVSLKELFNLFGMDMNDFFCNFSNRRMTYGYIEGNPRLLKGISSLYKNVKNDNIITTHGAAGANHLLLSSLIEPFDHVISVMPTYQQLYSIPESIGAKVDIIKLKKENNYQIDIEELEKMVTPDTKLLCLNNPNNPTGALITKETLKKIIDICRKNNVYILCDEVYRHLSYDNVYMDSIVDLYEKGISVGSMSKVFSLAGLRIGWIVTLDKHIRKQCLSHRDYSLISCGLLDEEISAIALKNKDILLNRNIELIKTNLDILKKWAKENPKISFIEPKASTVALLHYDYEINSFDFCKTLIDKYGVLLTPGDCFEEEKALRIGFACDTHELEKGLYRMSEYINTLI